jgi:hypothetical protein
MCTVYMRARAGPLDASRWTNANDAKTLDVCPRRIPPLHVLPQASTQRGGSSAPPTRSPDGSLKGLPPPHQKEYLARGLKEVAAISC